MTKNPTFTAVFQAVPEGDGGGYHAYIEELPGAITQGRTLEEARVNLLDAAHELLAAYRQSTASFSRGKVIRERIAIPSD